jgi:hypothetical protein
LGLVGKGKQGQGRHAIRLLFAYVTANCKSVSINLRRVEGEIWPM